MTNIRKIARESGVSIATVSRILDPTKRHLVSPETIEAVELVIRKHRYIPNMAARALTRKCSNTLGIVAAFSTDVVQSPYFRRLISGILLGVEHLNYDLKWILIKNDDRETATLHQLRQKHLVDGLIFLNWRIFPKLVKEIEKKGNFPAVLINDYTSNVQANIIHCDNQMGMNLLVDYIRSKNYQSLGILRGPEYISYDALERFQVLKKACAKKKIQVKASHLIKNWNFAAQDGYKNTASWLQTTSQKPRCLFAMNDGLAIGALKAIREAKIKTPGELAVIGYDGNPETWESGHDLTTFIQPLEEMGKEAVFLLHEQLKMRKFKPVQKAFSPVLKPGKTG